MQPLPVLAALILVGISRIALAADPGEAWFTETAGAGVTPDGVEWVAPGSLCSVLKDKLPHAVKALESESYALLTAKTLIFYAGISCKSKYGQFPFLVRAVSAAGEWHLDAGLLRKEVWMRYAGMGSRYPFEKTPVVLWLYTAPSRVNISVSIVE